MDKAAGRAESVYLIHIWIFGWLFLHFLVIQKVERPPCRIESYSQETWNEGVSQSTLNLSAAAFSVFSPLARPVIPQVMPAHRYTQGLTGLVTIL